MNLKMKITLDGYRAEFDEHIAIIDKMKSGTYCVRIYSINKVLDLTLTGSVVRETPGFDLLRDARRYVSTFAESEGDIYSLERHIAALNAAWE